MDEALGRRDAEARIAAQRVFDRPLVLEAGAGTGKTTTLVARVLAWSLGPGWRRAADRLAADPRRPHPTGGEVAAEVLDRVVAITFTEAAAAEMASRVGAELGRLAAGEPLPGWLAAAELPEAAETAHRARTLVGVLDHLVVQTIHAFCRRLLAAHPLEAGLHPQLTIDAEQDLADQIVRETVEGVLTRAYGDPGDEAAIALAAEGYGPQALAEGLAALVEAGVPAASLEADPLGPEAVAAFVARLDAGCRRLHDLLPADLSRRHLEKAREVRAALAAVLAATARRPVELAALLDRLRGSFGPSPWGRLKEWRGEGCKSQAERGTFAGRTAEIAAAARELVPLVRHARAVDPRRLDLARRVMAPLLARIEAELTARGIATFQALLVEAARLLRRRPDVRARLRAGIDQLLVDEFQDTDRLQCEVVRWLALDGPPASRPELFLVGDPKQSIYGWRSADLAAYEGFVAEVLAAGGERHPLAQNFRSVPPILAEVERCLAPVMVAEQGVQPPFEPLFPSPERAAAAVFARSGEDGGTARGVIEHWVSWAPPAHGEPGLAATRAATAREIEAQAIARDVAEVAREEGLPWGAFAILLRATGDLDTYLDALRQRRIPFAVGRDKSYYRRREVIDAAALVRAVLDPGDHLALVTLLRSPVVGVPDAAFLPLWRREVPRRLTDLTGPDAAAVAALAADARAVAAALPAEVPGLAAVAGWEDSFAVAVAALAEARESFRRDPPDRFVERLRRLFPIETVEAGRYLGAYRLANLERFFRRLVAVFAATGGDEASLLRTLRRAVAEAREAEEGQPQEGREDAVRVLTIHGAKGLQFSHVYLPQLDRQPQAESGPLTKGSPASPEYRLLGFPTLGWDRVEEEERRVADAEQVRTLYVAATRARERLVLAGVWESRGRKPQAPPAHLDLLAARADRPDVAAGWDAARAAVQAGRPPPPLRDAAGALWRFPALEALASEPEPDAAEPADLPDPAAAAAASRRLAALREAAAERNRRPFIGYASADSHARLDAEGDGGAGRGGERSRAMAIGTALHRALEELEASADPATEAARLRARLPAWLAAAGAAGDGAALASATELFDRLAGGRLLARLRELGPAVLARELPILVPPAEGEEEGDGARPVGFVAGAIDLVYRDPATGTLVVADYKTDAVADDDEIAARVDVYRPQGAVYARAVRDALGLAEAPRFELWFLRADRIVVTPEQGSRPPAVPPARPPSAGAPDTDREPVQGVLFEL
jgi:ATP-dependent helicase/nuclease subunit A